MNLTITISIFSIDAMNTLTNTMEIFRVYESK
jgi:hypothetical protein